MIGIVLWCDPNDCKAVFWCEDHGELAYFNAEYDEVDRTGENVLFAAGDMVQFDIYCDVDFRRALNPSVVQQNACDGLEKSLRSSAQPYSKPVVHYGGGQVVPFRPRERTHQPARHSLRSLTS